MSTPNSSSQNAMEETQWEQEEEYQSHSKNAGPVSSPSKEVEIPPYHAPQNIKSASATRVATINKHQDIRIIKSEGSSELDIRPSVKADGQPEMAVRPLMLAVVDADERPPIRTKRPLETVSRPHRPYLRQTPSDVRPTIMTGEKPEMVTRQSIIYEEQPKITGQPMDFFSPPKTAGGPSIVIVPPSNDEQGLEQPSGPPVDSQEHHDSLQLPRRYSQTSREGSVYSTGDPARERIEEFGRTIFQTLHEATESPTKFMKFCTTARDFVSWLFLFVGFTVLCVAQLTLGILYVDKCPTRPMLPTYLIVSGIFGLFLQCVTVYRNYAPKDEDWLFKNQRRLCLCCEMFFYVFFVAWFIAGCSWVYGAGNSDASCLVLYLLTYWMFNSVFTILTVIVAIRLICCFNVCIEDFDDENG